jgi:predicted transposase YbfD/YdcC
MVMIVLIGMLAGCNNLKDARLYASINQKLFAKWLNLPLTHGIPDPTNISRLFQKLDVEELVVVCVELLQLLGVPLNNVYSFDGKTMRAVTGVKAIRHILSMFCHGNHLALGQIGVSSKENEIPAFDRLVAQCKGLGIIVGRLLIGDALFTQKAIIKTILSAGADFLFVVKGNQKVLRETIAAELSARPASDKQTFTDHDTTRKRNITTTVTLINAKGGEEMLPSLTGSNHWDGVKTMGILHRTGTRTSKDGTVHEVDETIGFISSRLLSAEEVTIHLHHHWCIENNLHWVKDEVLSEDKHTLRLGKAPQVMTWIRSTIISLCNGLEFKSISDVIHNLSKSTALMDKFLRSTAII